MPHPLGDELTELHVHLGGSVDPAALWGIAHEQGIRLLITAERLLSEIGNPAAGAVTEWLESMAADATVPHDEVDARRADLKAATMPVRPK